VNWKDNWERFRRFIDDEPYDPIPVGIEAAAANKSESERFLQKLKEAIEGILRQELTRIANTNKAYIPERFIVFMSAEAYKSLRDDKRRFFEHGLGSIVLDTARELASPLHLTSKKIAVAISVNALLDGDEIEVRALSGDAQATLDQFETESSKAVSKHQDYSETATIKDKGTIRDTDFGLLYRVEVSQAGKKVADYPVILQKNTIGREDDEEVANLRLPTDNRKISRIHAEISLDDEGDLWVTALHENPTVVSGKILRNGEKMRLGLDREIKIYDFTIRIEY
jgi:hypothetical protein